MALVSAEHGWGFGMRICQMSGRGKVGRRVPRAQGGERGRRRRA
jgi:hypothetical protein